MDPPDLQEILDVIKELKNNKCGGANGIVAEIYKLGGYSLQENLLEVIHTVWEAETMPRRWKESLIYPIHKKGDQCVCENYRGIALLDVAYKILGICIKNRLQKEADKYIGDYQAGFRANRSTLEQVYILKETLANSYEHNLAAHVVFIDFKQAYDSIIKQKVIEILKILGINEKLIRLVGMTLAENFCKVLINGEVSSEFGVNRGLRQGDPMSPILFNLCLEWSLRVSGLYRGGTIVHHSHQILAYADDIAIVTRTVSEMEKVVRKLLEASALVGLTVNEAKTKYLRLRQGTQQNNIDLTIKVQGQKIYKFEKVDKFVYLGVTISDNISEDIEIASRITKGNRCVGGLQRFIKSKKISRSAKIRTYKTIIRPTVLYGSELWVLSRRNEKLLASWERQVLRKIFGGVKIDDEWYRRSNQELYDLYGDFNIVGVIKANRVRWLGHVVRRKDNSAVKSIYRGGVCAKKRRGRPKGKWLESVKRDLKELKIEKWEEKAVCRKKWRDISKEAMGLQGL